MQKLGISKHRRIWLSVLVLFALVAASIFALSSRLGGFLLNDEGAIPLISEKTSGYEDNVSSYKENIQPSYTHVETDSSAGITTSASIQSSKNPDFEVSDQQKVWSTNTQVEIFRVSYVNGEQVITVNSDKGDNVIAPGTENSYTFKLKNNGNTAIDYTMTVDAYFTPGDIEIPITGRLNRYDGKWIAGNKENYVNPSVLDTAGDKATLGAGKYTYYTLDWLWPFESGNDKIDTMLGDMAVGQDLVFTVVITTTAAESADPYEDSGITPPNTGYDSNLVLWIVLVIALFVLVFSSGLKKRQ